MTMAAAPPTVGASWTESQSSTRAGPQGLQMGMSGLSLVNDTPSGRAPSDEPASRNHSFGSISIPSSDQNLSGLRGTPPPPGSPQLQKSLYQINTKVLAKPPGLGVFSVPSPIGKNSTTNNTLSSSPNLTLTPSSSVDGNCELFGGFALQDSSFMTENSAQFDASDGVKSRSPWSDFGHAFGGVGAFESDPDDGLHGLGALRDRAHSSPGPNITGLLSTSPPVRIDLSAHQGDLSPLYSEMDSRQRVLPPDPRRIRATKESTVPRFGSRPPLSGGGSLSQSPYNFDVSYGEITRNSVVGISQDSSGLQRPELNYSASDGSGGYGRHMRSRSSGGIVSDFPVVHQLRGANIESYGHHQHQLIDQSHSHKFGTLPNLINHIQQQQHRNLSHSQHNFFPGQNRHTRSFSHSGALQHTNVFPQETYEGKSLGRSYDGSLLHASFQNADVIYSGDNFSGITHGNGLGRSASAGDKLSQSHGLFQRNSGISQPSSHLTTAMNGAQDQRRNSDTNQGGFSPHGGQQGVQTRQSQYQQRKEDFNHSISQPNLSGQLESTLGGPNLQRRNSDVYQGGMLNYGGQQGMGGRQLQYQQRREDCNKSPRYDGTDPIMATPDEMRLFNMNVASNEGSSAFGHNQSQTHNNASMTGRHNSSGSLTSSPMSADGSQRPHQRSGSFGMSHSHSTGGLPPFQNQSHPGQYGMDDDLSHPLAGEHINDPGDDLGFSNNGISASIVHHSNQLNSYNHGPPVMNMNRHASASMERSPMGMNPYGQADAMQFHGSGGPQSPRPVVYNVKFKRTQRTFIVGPRVHGDLKMGCYVKVEADRGEDLGIVVGKAPVDKFNAPGRTGYRTGMQSQPGMPGDMSLLGAPGAMGPHHDHIQNPRFLEVEPRPQVECH